MGSAASSDRSGERNGDARAAGSVIAGRFRVDVLLGSGGMATVYRAKDLATNKHVALKLLRRELSTIPEAASRFRREGELLQGFTHPGIVRVETFGALEDGTLFLAMELLEGETLGQMMRRRGALDPDEVAPILTGACAALASAHAKGIVHRDLKPDNVFLVRAEGASEDDFQVKLLDFGISKVFGSERLTQTGELLGTPRYMAPEQLAADHDLDGRVDVYALGVMLYETLAACPPFLGSTPSDLIVAILNGKVAPLRSVRADLPPEIESVVMRTMARAREARYATPEALANAFVSALGRPSTPGPMRGAARARPGMETAVLGSMQSAPVARGLAATNERAAPPTLLNAPAMSGQAARAAPMPVAEALVPGTLTGFAASVAASNAVASNAVASNAVATPVAPVARAAAHAVPQRSDSPAAPRGGAAAEQRSAAPSVGAGSPAGAPPPRSASASSSGVGAHPFEYAPQLGSGAGSTGRREAIAEEPFVLPTQVRGRTVVIILVALLAGAISMAAAIMVLKWWSRSRAAAEPTPQIAQPVSALPTGGAARVDGQPALPGAQGLAVRQPAIAQPAIAQPATAQPATDGPGGAAPPLGAVPAGVAPPPSQPAERAERHRRNDREVPPATTPDAPPAPPTPTAEPHAPQTPSELMAAARAAYSRGEPEVCTTLVEQALAAGAPAIALKLQGDCFRRSGRNADALRSYQRFCRLVPDNPAMSEVQALAEGLGGSCP